METKGRALRRTPCGLSGVRHLRDLEIETVVQLETICRCRKYNAGQTVVMDGEHPVFVGCVKTGFLRMQKTLSDGRQHIVGLLVEGDMFGRVFDGPLHFGIEAATEAEICVFPRAAFEDLLTRAPALERIVLLNLLDELDRARDWMILLSYRKVSTRLAGFLLILSTRFAGIDDVSQTGPAGREVKIPIGRSDLAQLLGARTESISRALHALASEGCIEVLAPDRVRIRDASALARTAGDEELGAHLNKKRSDRVAKSLLD